ncbi:MAG: FecR domain-containing protein [Roseobacter sp.]
MRSSFSMYLNAASNSRSCAKTSRSATIAGALFFGIIATTPSYAQSTCTWTTLDNPTRQLIVCGQSLTVEREQGSDVTIVERRGDAPPAAIDLQNGALFIEVEPDSTPTLIRTPNAIAAVRGTTYVVDARPDSTSVFVLKGAVNVTKPEAAGVSVTLGPGEGVDVDAASPLEVKVWPVDRVASLLGRFGR